MLSKRLIIPLAVSLLVLFAVHYSAQRNSGKTNEPFESRFGPVMGTEGYVKILPSDKMSLSAQDAFNSAYKQTKNAEAKLSRFVKSSDISKLNNAAAGEKVKVSPVTWQTLLEARRFYQLSDGSFDPTIGVLMSIYPWGEHEIPSLPDKQEVQKALSDCGFEHLKFYREGMYVAKDIDKLFLDTGGIAKGLGVDIMASALKSAGVKDAIIEIGGEITVIGSIDLSQKSTQTLGSEGKIWTTGIKDPRGKGIIRKFAANGGVSIATSGDYEKYFTVKDKRYSHIIDPATGYPTTSGIISATIITRFPCVVADALATTISVIGVDRSRELLKLFPDTRAFLVMEDKKQITIDGGIKDIDLPTVTESTHD